MTRSTATPRTVAVTALAAAATFAVVDVGLRQITPPHAPREVEDAVGEWRNGAPQVLFVGSSHGRTFDLVGDLLERESRGDIECLAIPVEFGKWSSYRWVLDHRIWPALEAHPARRDRLRHLVVATEWWDSTAAPGGGGRAENLPSRAWEIADFVADAAQHGLTSYNKNYLHESFRRLFRWSTIVQDRGQDQILRDLKDRLRPRPADEDARNHALQVAGWRRTVEEGVARLFDPYETQALEAMLERAAALGVEVTILLYPRMPVTLTEAAQGPDGTLSVFAQRMAELARAHGARLVDVTTGSPLRDEHFARDFDHVTAEGNALLAPWLLDHGLEFLRGVARDRGGR